MSAPGYLIFESVCSPHGAERNAGSVVSFRCKHRGISRLRAVIYAEMSSMCGAILRDALAARGLLRMRAAVCGATTMIALILRSMRAQHACVSKDGRTRHQWSQTS